MNTKLGAHLSISGSYTNPLKSIVEKGGNALQIFSCSPRGWNNADVSDHQLSEFLSKKKELGIDPIYFHACYLINLADEGNTGHMSKKALVHELNLAAKMQIKGSIIHTGSFKEKQTEGSLFEVYVKYEKYPLLIQNIKEILEQIPQNVYMILENAGTRKIGQTLEELAAIMEDVNDSRIRICLDTCHLHAAGYDLRTEESFEQFLNRFDALIGIDNLEVIHMNDSRDPFGSLRDRHANIGQGEVGIDVFKHLLNHPKTKDKAFIIETPGFDDKGPDKKNLDILQSLVV